MAILPIRLVLRRLLLQYKTWLLFYIKNHKTYKLFFFLRKLLPSVIRHLYSALVERLAIGQFATVPAAWSVHVTELCGKTTAILHCRVCKSEKDGEDEREDRTCPYRSPCFATCWKRHKDERHY